MTLEPLVENERPGPVFAMSDGIVHEPDRERVPLERRQTIDRLVVAAYEGNRKVVLDLESNEFKAYDPDADPLETADLSAAEGPELAALVESARNVGRKILGREESELTADVEDRLRSWGYI
ncbi:MAG: hypothetical protein L3J96_06895 [Thermoplasmata archaeon]|nr:hypothetical protein [Thermoplasmata archaeon]